MLLAEYQLECADDQNGVLPLCFDHRNSCQRVGTILIPHIHYASRDFPRILVLLETRGNGKGIV